jgi:hypothetical protein
MKTEHPFPATVTDCSTTEYFAVLSDGDRRGPFDSVSEPIRILKQTSRDLGHTDDEARHFFLHESAIEQVETVDGKTDCFRLGWLAREESGREEEFSPEERASGVVDIVTTREQESIQADAHFTTTARKAIEVNEGGLVDPMVP